MKPSQKNARVLHSNAYNPVKRRTEMEKQRLGVGRFVGFLGVTLGFEPQLGYNLYNYGEIDKPFFLVELHPQVETIGEVCETLQQSYSTEMSADLCKLTTFYGSILHSLCILTLASFCIPICTTELGWFYPLNMVVQIRLNIFFLA